jgi:hypothetical protein
MAIAMTASAKKVSRSAAIARGSGSSVAIPLASAAVNARRRAGSPRSASRSDRGRHSLEDRAAPGRYSTVAGSEGIRVIRGRTSDTRAIAASTRNGSV